MYPKLNQAKLIKNVHVVQYSSSHLATNPSHVSFGLAYSKPKSSPAQPASHYLNEKLLFPETATKSGHLMLEMAQHLDRYPQHYSKLKEQNLATQFTKLETSRNKPHPHPSEELLYISTKEQPYTKYSSKELNNASPLLIKSKPPLPSNRPWYLTPKEDKHLESSAQSGYLMLEMTQHTVNKPDYESKTYNSKENEFVGKRPKSDHLKTKMPHSSSSNFYSSQLHSNQMKTETKAPKVELFQNISNNLSSKIISPKVHYFKSETNEATLKTPSSNLVKVLSPKVIYADPEPNDNKKERLNTKSQSHSKSATEANYSKIKLTQHSPSTPHYSNSKAFQAKQELSHSNLNINHNDLPKAGFDELSYSKQKETKAEHHTNIDQLYPPKTVMQSGYLMLEMIQHLPSHNKSELKSYQRNHDKFDRKPAPNYEKLKNTHSSLAIVRDESQLTYVQPKLTFSQSDSVYNYDKKKTYDSELTAVGEPEYSALKMYQSDPMYIQSKLAYSHTKQPLMVPKFETESEIEIDTKSETEPHYSELARAEVSASVPHFAKQKLYKQVSKSESPFDLGELSYLDDKKSSYPLLEVPYTDPKVVLDHQEAPFIKSEMFYTKPEVSSQEFDNSQVHYIQYGKEKEEKEEEEDDDDDEEKEEGELEVEQE